MKDRKTRDAVRSVLERFTGQKTLPDAAIPAPASAPAAEAPKAN
jgi:AsmA protein